MNGALLTWIINCSSQKVIGTQWAAHMLGRADSSNQGKAYKTIQWGMVLLSHQKAETKQDDSTHYFLW